MIKYLGSKRRLVPVLGAMIGASAAGSVLDLFTGTTRVAQEARRLGAIVTAVDSARYAADAFARCYVQTILTPSEATELADEVARLDALPGVPGYVTEVFCRQGRFLQPDNGARVDAIRSAIAVEHAGGPWEPVLLTALVEAADRVDSTVGVQMAYLKTWSARSSRRLRMRMPEIPDGPAGRAIRGDAVALVSGGHGAAGASASNGAGGLGPFDFAYLDPPYNQHRYLANYHVWETIVAGDEPEHYGVAMKRVECRSGGAASAFNRRGGVGPALAACVAGIDAPILVVSYSDEGWLALADLTAMAATRGAIEVLSFDSRRYVGAQIGIHDPSGKRVGQVSHVRNIEHLLVCGDAALVRRVAEAGRAATPLA